MRRRFNHRSQLTEHDIKLVVTEEGKYEVYHKGRKKNALPHKTYHKYGKTIEYRLYSFYDSKTKKQFNILEHVLVWLWFNISIPAKYDIDHIDSNKLNNHIDNLQLLTRKENLRKRGVGRNQYSYHLTDDEILEMRAEKKRGVQARRNKQQEFLARLENN